MQVGGVDEVVTVTAESSVVNTRSGELSYLVTSARSRSCRSTAATTPTSRCCSRPSWPIPHRDGGSVVAHGLGMSVNGQDPRSNVYLLDGTLLNDMTNGPAGSAAGTALGMETVQEFRVETNAYSAEFGRMSGGQINVLTKAGSNTCAAAPTSSIATTRSTRRTTSTSPASRRSRATSSAAPPAGRCGATSCSTSSATKRCTRISAGRSRRPCPTTTRASGCCPDPAQPGRAAQRRRQPRRGAVSRRIPARQRRASSATAPRSTASSSIRRSIRTSCRAASTTTSAPGSQLFARYTIDDAEQRLPTDYPQFPRSFVSRNQFFTGEYRQRAHADMLGTLSRRLQPHARRAGRSRPTRRRRSRRSCPAARSSATSTSAASIASARRARSTCAFCSRCSACRATRPTTRGRSCSSSAAIAERYLQDMVNPTFSLGTYSFANLRAFLENRADQLHRPHAARRSSIATGASGCSAATRRTSSRLTLAAHAERRPALRSA